ncbi:MAG: glycerate kinase [Clostridia bacterium]
MKKIILIPDSFKGTMTSIQICTILKRAIQTILPDVSTISIPVGDGGEGTAEAFRLAAGGQRYIETVCGPHFEPVEAAYTILPDGTAVIEMAAAAGIPLCKGPLDPMTATTYGVGQLIDSALEQGCTRIILGLGGSATNDGGCGAACALGAQFFDSQGKLFIPSGGTLGRIATLDLTELQKKLDGAAITCMCDIDNPLFGPNGAAAVFAPQKGATEEQIQILDDGLHHLSEKLLTCTNRDVANLPGAGAAGGMGGGCAALFHAELKSGIETVLNTVGFDALASGADLVITGEGKIDGQSARGKVISGVSQRTQALKIPCIAIVGDAGNGYESLYGKGLTAVFSINRTAIPFEQARLRAGDDLYRTACDLLRLIRECTA